MLFTVDGIEFEICSMTGTGERDGAGCELWVMNDNLGGQIVMEIFRNDEAKKIEFSSWSDYTVPLAAVENLIQFQDEYWGRIFTPLS
ncbi:hypothetical protein GCM10011495_12350 [Hymenobacter frigidus]|uniref:Uncharacterized protein n=1 Tax=Hymenobacter frigidus TaxID=1524095 RepID=A0ABQ2A290_9BACT|nr:hypothetical protein [Hymenobacter frigidus]GGH83115.1 hypothetical protein GCM10011495_12350 [Hymenobacter frigidus]